MIYCFRNQWKILICAALLWIVPSEAHANGEVLLVQVVYPVLGFIHLGLLLVLIAKLKGRQVSTVLVYILLVVTMWSFVLYLPMVDDPVDPRDVVIRQLGLIQRIYGNHERRIATLIEKFGENSGFALYLGFAVGIPILLPPLIAGALYFWRDRLSRPPVQ